jgi:hypothetical protein
MNVMSVFGNYLGAEHLGTTTPTVTIADVRKEEIADEKGALRTKAVVHFMGTNRSFILNRTNALTIAAMFGMETATWAGKRIVLYATEVQLGRERVAGVRIKGSPDIEKDITFDLKLPRKKAQRVTLTRTANGTVPAPAPIPDSTTSTREVIIDTETGEAF